MSRPAVFLDRDGTAMEEVHYCADPALVRLIPGAAGAIRRLRAAGYLAVLITNQSGIGRGLISPSQYEAVHAEFLRQLAAEGAALDGAYYCADVSPSPRRKPAPGMVLEATAELGVDLARSWFVGDKAADIGCGQAAGVRTLLVQTGYGKGESTTPDFVVADLPAAAEIILQSGNSVLSS